MKIVIAPDSFKESLTAWEAAAAMERGFREELPAAEIVKVPMADGGEGTVQSLVDATGGKILKKVVTGPLGQPVEAFYGILGSGKTAVIEMAAASGLHLVPAARRNPLVTTTWGTGELILAALDEGVEHIIIGIGGSATNDGGAGMAQALGVKLLNHGGSDIAYGGGALAELSSIDMSVLDKRLKKVKLEVACDVDNPLVGPNGASAVYGPQKGATADMVNTLDQNLTNYANVIEKQLGKEVKNLPGAGAAGGLGAGLVAFFNAELKRGVEIVIAATNLEEDVKDAALVVTGEGAINKQTIQGKVPVGVAKVAKKYKIPVIAIAGLLAEDSPVVHRHGIDAIFSCINTVCSLEEALANAEENIYRCAKNVAAVWKMGKSF
ncbi:glycerate kinase [Desulfofalx alkaliphila]|uniref:glycerate kinase n=1 Tax=Desulfofalx alkaliphila TaxID=105483 RepID=UPI0004E26B00|nr:glycerate kinase [Desulfofalx alkaliphila]